MKVRTLALKRSNINYLLGIAFVIIALLLAACSSKPESTEQTQPEQNQPVQTEMASTEETVVETAAADQIPVSWDAVTNKVWVLIAYGDGANPTVVEPGTYTTINFHAADDQVGGTGGCNNFITSYTSDDQGNLTIASPITSQEVVCEKGMEQENYYFNALGQAVSYSMTEQGRLVINYQADAENVMQLIYKAENPVINTIWVLSSYGDASNPTPATPGVLSTAVFSADGTLNGNGGCNNYNATYEIQGNQINISQPASTRMACEKGTEQENAFLTTLAKAETFRIMNDTLTITADGGATALYFSARNLPLENVRWKLALVNGQPVDASINATALFTPANSPLANGAENVVSGSGGCNDFTGPYSVEGNTISAGPFAATAMACDEPVMQVEQAFMSGLEKAQSYETLMSQLTITTADGSLIFYADRMALEGPVWTLKSLGTISEQHPPVEGSNFTATFSRGFGVTSGVQSGSTGCNDYNAIYHADTDEIKINLPQSTQKSCADPLATEEQNYFLGLNAARDYRILGNEMQIFYDGNMFVFTGSYPTPPAEATLMPLNGTTWYLTSLGDAPVLPDSQVTISFVINPDETTGQISGLAGCNNYSGEIVNIFSLSNISAAKMICDSPNGVMEQESTYLAALGTANSILLNGNMLTIGTNMGTLVYESGASIPEGPQPTEPAITETAAPTEPVVTEEPPTEGEPKAVINGPTEGKVGDKLIFDAYGSSPGAGITSYEWDFGDGSAVEVEAEVEHIYSAEGTYLVTLTIVDANGQSSQAGIEVIITAK